jgi:hypothetical protein
MKQLLLPFMTHQLRFLFVLFAFFALVGCDDRPKSSDDVQRDQQEQILGNLTATIGMPVIHGRERQLMHDILEMRDSANLVTYSYTYAENSGTFHYIGETIGFPIPYATQFTNPQKYERVSVSGGGYGYQTLPQADPNGLFSPASADGTWIVQKIPGTDQVAPQYIEPKVAAFTYKLSLDKDGHIISD